MKKLAIIDTFALLHRAYHAIPPTLTTKDGLMVNAAYGFSAILLRLMKELKPDYIVAAFDLPGGTFRNKEYKEYKAHREAPDKDFIDQISIIEDILAALSIPKLALKGYEADDVIGSIARYCNEQEKDIEVIIVSGDLDTLQLVNKRTVVYTMRKSINDTLIYDEAAVRERYGLTPAQIIDLKSLKGDTSDNIPGVKGIGEKGAIDLVKEFGSLENIYTHIESKKIKDRTRELLKDQKDMAFQSKMLATIVTDLKVNLDLTKADINNYDLPKVTKLFQKLEFRSLLAKLPTSNGTATTKPATKKKSGPVYEVIDDEAGMKKLAALLVKKKQIAIDTETTGLDTLHAEILGASIAWAPKEAVFIHLRDDQQRTAFKKHLGSIITDPAIKKIGHNIKYDYQILDRFGLRMQGIYFDTLLAGFLLHSDRSLKIEELAFTYLGVTMQTLADLVDTAASDDKPKKKKDLDVKAIDPEKLAQYGAADSDMCFRLYEKIAPLIKKEKLTTVLETIDMPVVPILAHMEHDGILLDVPYLKAMEKELRKQIESLEKKIHTLAGFEFNIASPLQLKEVLFEKLAIETKGIKRKKTGLSTAADELEKLKNAHPIINLILEYREITKLVNTYVATLPDEIDRDDKRIHTDYSQTIAATGRLSSNHPNLQNIPIRTELGRTIRKAFIAPKGKVLISADYSQIELRIAAIISKDPKMLASFKKGEDIHRATAAAINNIPMDQVTPDQRRAAKEVNFGVIYGLGSTGLAQRTGITRLEAKEFIEKYFGLYKKLKQYLDDTKSFAHAHGYVMTIFGRRRRLPEIYSSSPMLVAQAERMAINMPIQGTATGDIIKLAMIACDTAIQEQKLPAKMLLQVHDELVFEADTAAADKATKEIKKAMESVGNYEIPLLVDVKTGENWAEMEEV